MLTPLNMEKSRPYQLHDSSFQMEESPNEKKHVSTYSVENNDPLVSLSSKDEKMSIASVLKSAISEIMSLSRSESNNIEHNGSYFNDSVSNISSVVTNDDEYEEHIFILLDDISKSLSMNLYKISDGIESVSNLVLGIYKNVGEKVSNYITGKSNVLVESTNKSQQESDNYVVPEIFNSVNSEENTTANTNTKFNNEILNLTKNNSKILTSIAENIENNYIDVSNDNYSSIVEGSKRYITPINNEDSPLTEKEFLEYNRDKIATLTDKIIQSVFHTTYSIVDSEDVKNSFINKIGNYINNMLPSNKTNPSMLTTNITNLQRNGDLSNNKTSVENLDLFNLTNNVKNTMTSNKPIFNDDYKSINNFKDIVTNIEKKNGDVSNSSMDLYNNNFLNSSTKEEAVMSLVNSNSEVSENEKYLIENIIDIGSNILKSTDSMEETLSDILKEEKVILSKVGDMTSIFNDFFELQSEENLTNSYYEEDTKISNGLVSGKINKETGDGLYDSSFLGDMLKYKIMGFLSSSMFISGILPVAGAILTGLAAGGIVAMLANKYLADPIWKAIEDKRNAKVREENIHVENQVSLKRKYAKELFGSDMSEDKLDLEATKLFSLSQEGTNMTEKEMKRIVQDYKISGAKDSDEYLKIRGNSTNEKIDIHNRKIDKAIEVLENPDRYNDEDIEKAYSIKGIGTDKYKNAMEEKTLGFIPRSTRVVNAQYGEEYKNFLKDYRKHSLKNRKDDINISPNNFSNLSNSEIVSIENNTSNVSNSNKTEFSEVGDVVTSNRSISVGDSASSNISPKITNVSTDANTTSNSKNLSNISKSIDAMVELNKGILQVTAGLLEKPMTSGGGTTVVPVVVKDDFSTFDKAYARTKLASTN